MLLLCFVAFHAVNNEGSSEIGVFVVGSLHHEAVVQVPMCSKMLEDGICATRPVQLSYCC